MKDARLFPKSIRKMALGGDGWWYEDPCGVDIYLQRQGEAVIHARIGWGALLRAAQRSSGKEIMVKP